MPEPQPLEGPMSGLIPIQIIADGYVTKGPGNTPDPEPQEEETR